MEIKILKPKKALNKAFLKVKPNRTDIEIFKNNLIKLLDKVDEIEREENQKTHLRDFLRDTYYKENHEINTKDTADLVIHHDKTNKSDVGVIIEAKRPSNKSEMIRLDDINKKALQELLLYYLRERITGKNLNIKNLIISNVYEWYIFDEHTFERLFAQNKRLVKQFQDFEVSKKSTDVFYKEIAEPAINELIQSIEFTYFDIRDYEKPLRNNDQKDDIKLIALFKLLSPEHLLNLPFTNDSNSLDKRFYGELLHIIGLSETKDGGKKIIERNKKGERNTGSLLENAIIQLDSLDKINRLDNPSQYGVNLEERLFNVGLELSITWINRILFLKLLEAQLKTYHKGDKSFEFLSFDKIHNYDDLNSLFFQVLAKKQEERNDDVNKLFAKVPYLNSSLFEPTEIEHNTLLISNLQDDKTLPIYSASVLKDDNGKKRSGELDAIEYLFEFLNAYDFSSEGSEEIQEDNKTLINASVLGLIFEKINGYKDGSFFTPGFITMYMCRETIRKSVIQKFNETKDWECTDFNALYNKIDDTQEANDIINSLKICDPAVGSGHFLVSALNEIISVKNDLKVLQDRQGKRLKEYHFEVVNDELIVTDEDGELFEYNPANKESQRIQETLFHEKQTVIENCLFGVDINPNSVKICRLRLWIELLKNAYYKNPTELETLPNIDINIKCGNSLVSRFDIDSDLKQALKKSKWTIDSYRLAVDTYRNAENKEQKREMEKLIADIKSDFRSEISLNDPKLNKFRKISGELFTLTQQQSLFEMSKKEKSAWNKKVLDLTKESKKLESEIEEIKSNKIYENAFEWRFEFPEVLNEVGDFVGFDAVIGNPPYVFSRENFNDEHKKYYYNNFKGIDYQLNLYVLFAELTLNILNKSGNYSLIVPNTLLMVSSTAKIRKLLFSNASISEVVNFLGESFEGVSVETVSYFGVKGKIEENIKISIGEKNLIRFAHNKSTNTVLCSPDMVLNVFSDDATDLFLMKLKENSSLLNDLVQIKSGLKAYQTGKGNPKQTADIVKSRPFDYNFKFNEKTYKYLEGKDVSRFEINWSGGYLHCGAHLAEPRVHLGEKLIIREITANHPHSILASHTNEDFVFNLSNIVITPKEDCTILLKFILALINSKLMSYYFQLNTAKAVRKMFPKIILKDLRQFPIKVITIEKQELFSTIVDEIINNKKNYPQSNTKDLENKIDQLVYKIYNLTQAEIELIENF